MYGDLKSSFFALVTTINRIKFAPLIFQTADINRPEGYLKIQNFSEKTRLIRINYIVSTFKKDNAVRVGH